MKLLLVYNKSIPRLLVLLLIVLSSTCRGAFLTRPKKSWNIPCQPVSSLFESPSSQSHDTSGNDKKVIKGDPLRAATGIRPSLHPVTINAIATVLKLRAQNNPEVPLRVSEKDGVEPIQVALSAGKIAADAIAQRQKTSSRDGMELEPKEEQTIAGRIVGVAMRLDELEAALLEKCQAATWIGKYNEWDTFGVLKDEKEQEKELFQRILDDPLFCMNRAECLLALFLRNVEEPQLKAKKEEVPDNSLVDFLDEDRSGVLIDQ